MLRLAIFTLELASFPNNHPVPRPSCVNTGNGSQVNKYKNPAPNQTGQYFGVKNTHLNEGGVIAADKLRSFTLLSVQGCYDKDSGRL